MEAVEKPLSKAKQKAQSKKRARDEAEAEKSAKDNEPTPEETFDGSSFSIPSFSPPRSRSFPTVATSLPAWAHLDLPTPLFRALHELNFLTPTAIQERSLLASSSAPPAAASDPDAVVSAFPESSKSRDGERDIVGIAQTGSGKTYAYGLPILHHILSPSTPPPPPPAPASDAGSDEDGEDYDLDPNPPSRLSALILCPTRELALQVRAALASLAVRTLPLRPSTPETDALAEEDPRKRYKGRLVNVVCLTGGMSVDKQKRQLEKGADIVVATPGRLWDLIGDVSWRFSSPPLLPPHLSNLGASPPSALLPFTSPPLRFLHQLTRC